MERIWTSEQIRDRLHLYCKGIDRRDWPLVRSCFSDDHYHEHGAFSGSPDAFSGSPDAFVIAAAALLEKIPATHHSISNVHINLANDGQSASTEANFVAYHRIAAGHDVVAAVPTGGKATNWIVAGRYCDQMELRNGQWLIVKRKGIHDWEHYEDANP